MKHSRLFSGIVAVSLLLSSTPSAFGAFSDVRSVTPFATAIETLQRKGVVEGYADGSYKPLAGINRAEFLKIVLESQGGEFEGANCFPDVAEQWFAKYVCTAFAKGIVEGYPSGLFKPEQAVNFVEASKILSLAYGQSIEDHSPDWYEPYVRALEVSQAIPMSVETLEKELNRGEMAEMMWRLSEEITDQPSKGYLNVKYPDVAINLASSAPQRATSCMDLRAFLEEGNRSHGNMMYLEGDAVAVPTMARSMSDAGAPVAAMAQGAKAESFSETNVQVQGVDEADIVKTDGQYVYALTQGKLRITQVNPASAMKLVSTLELNQGFSPNTMYLDGDKLILLGNSWQQPTPRAEPAGRMMPSFYWGGNKAEVRIYDVSDRANPVLSRTVSFDGNTVSSRRIGNQLYLVLNKHLQWFTPGPIPIPLETDVLPKFSDSAAGGNEEVVSRCGDVTILPRVHNPQYLIVAAIPTDSTTAEVKREVVLGSADNVYMSLQNLFVAATHWHYHWRGSQGTSSEKTSIYRFAVTDDGLEMKAHGSVPGRILNQFSMDEHDSHFRVATTKGQVWNTNTPSSNNLYVLNMNLERTGEIEDIAPGETIYSARFMGDRAYLVTFKKVDPFFAIDVSDPKNPTILGQLKIPGYSDYLHPYDENHIIGFGKDAVEAKEGDFAWYQGMKMAIFKVTDPQNPTQLHTFAIGDRGTSSPLLHNHKALLFDKERNLLAFPVQVHKLTEDQKAQSTGSAWGEPVFQGAYIFDINLRQGFTLRGRISHYTDEDIKKAGSYFYGKTIERVLRVADSLITLSEEGVQNHDEGSLEQKGAVKYKDDNVTGCPSEDDSGTHYVSKDPETCATIDYFCLEDQTAFSNECGCGCVAQ